MREVIAKRLRKQGGVAPVSAVAIREDGTTHKFELMKQPDDFFPHGLAASHGKLGAGNYLLVVRARARPAPAPCARSSARFPRRR